MFTVVISEQEHLDSIKEYRSFLKPFLDNSHITFCRWLPEGQTLSETVPELYDTVSRHEKWRLIVVCDEEGLKQKNPFDLVQHTDPECPDDMERGEYLELRRSLRLQAYEQAARKPLTRLMTWLCQAPLVTEGLQNAQELDPEFREYMIQAKAKEELRKQIIGDEVPETTLPAEVICVAKRCYDREEYDIQNAWTIHHDLQYSRFYDWNLYFDKMRYLIFDILPKNHRNYTLDYIRFLYSLMILAENEVPMAALAPNRVYTLRCQNDEKALSKILRQFDAKLAGTQAKLKADILKLKNKTKPRLSDRDAKAIFCSNMTVPVSTVKEFDKTTLFVSREGLGLAGDCPASEEDRWYDSYRKSRRALVKYLKTPSRALRKTTTELHRMNKADLEDAGRLNEYQLEDVADYVNEEELKMVATRTPAFQNAEHYTKELEEQDKKIQNILERRMPRKWTVILGIAALVCYLIGFIPMFVANIHASQTAKELDKGNSVSAIAAVCVLPEDKPGVYDTSKTYDIYGPLEEETEYKLYLQENLLGKDQYYAGYMLGDYLMTTKSALDAKGVYMEKVTGQGVRFYTTDGTENTYIDMYLNANNMARPVLSDTPSAVYAYDNDAGTYVVTIGSTKYYLNTFGTCGAIDTQAAAPAVDVSDKFADITLFSLVFFLAGGALMAAVAVISLLCLKHPVSASFSDYNGAMGSIVKEVEGSLGKYSEYLSHACNVMRGNSVLNFCQELEDPDYAVVRMLKKHEMDVMGVRAELHEIFGVFLPAGKPEADPGNCYEYDFTRAQDYDYPIPFTADQQTRIEFLQKGNTVEVPVNFVKYMRLGREDLYD